MRKVLSVSNCPDRVVNGPTVQVMGRFASATGWRTRAPALAFALGWFALTHNCCLAGSMRGAESFGAFPICHAAKAF